jgi:hypothetical protein
MEGYWQRVAEMGKGDSPYRTTFAQFICVAETEAEAERLYGLHTGSERSPKAARREPSRPPKIHCQRIGANGMVPQSVLLPLALS